MLQELLAGQVFAHFLVFCRLGAIIMLMPILGERFVPNRMRLAFAALFTLLVTPTVAPILPGEPATVGGLALLVGGEIFVGVFIGYLGRLMLSALETAGMIISFQTGLSSALYFNPMLAEQGSLIGVFLTLTAMLLLFQTDLHHLMLRGAVDSYGLFRPGAPPPVGDFTQVIVRLVGESFRIGLQIAGPLLVIITVLYVALGLLSRLMPQLQVFFVALPLQLVLGLILFGLTLPTAFLIFMQYFSSTLGGLLRPS